MTKNNKSLLITKIIILAVCLLAAGYFAVKPKIVDTELPLAQISQNLPGQTVEENPIELIFAGDIMLDREVKTESEKQNDWRWPFLKITDELKEADIVFGNLEGPISDKGEKSDKITSFRLDPKTIEGLSYANFNILSVANNHTLDYGKEAFEDALSKLKEAGINFVGGGQNATEAQTPLIKEINGTKFAFLAYTNLCPSPSWEANEENAGINCVSKNDLEILKKEFENAKKTADIVIVSLHSGNEFTQNLSQFQIDFSKAAIDAGVDLIIGHHPHVVQKYEQYKDKWIFYSLGNFVFDQSFSEETMQGLMVKVIVKDKKIIEIIPIKTQINNSFQVEIAPVLDADGIGTGQATSRVILSSSKLAQGETLLIKINNIENPEGITGQFDSKEIKFFEADGKIFGLVGIGAKTQPGIYKLNFTFPDNFKIEKQIEVIKGNFKVTTLAFTPELEEKGYSATSVAETIATNDGVKLYQAMETTATRPYFSGSFTYPLVKIINVGAFGNIRKSGDISLQHLGVDLDANMDTPIYAVNDGVVTGVLELIDYGNTVVIDHGLGIFSLYLHLNKFNVSEGQKIKKDRIIGLSGNTGYSIAPHLHFSIKLNGSSVDPLKFIKTAQF